VLQEGTFERIGDAKTRTTDVRVIAATNRDLQKEVERGHFRADLYYRLGVFGIEVPPLRERREDLPTLAWHFITRSARRLDLRAPRLTPAALDSLTTYDWPGNLRELQHVLERAVILGRGKSLELGELLPRTESSSKPTASPAPDEPLDEARLELGARSREDGSWATGHVSTAASSPGSRSRFPWEMGLRGDAPEAAACCCSRRRPGCCRGQY
jgi:transcriptional regulator with GAF, ATPase, and Fis domain